MAEVNVETISIVTAAAAIVIAAVSIIIQNRKAEKTRQTELMVQLLDPFRDFEMIRHYFEILRNWKWTDYDDYVRKYAQKDTEYSKLIHVVTYFNTLGLLVKMKLIDLETVMKWNPEACLWFWEKVGPLFQEGQKRLIASGSWQMKYKPLEWFEYLYDEMKKREQSASRG